MRRMSDANPYLNLIMVKDLASFSSDDSCSLPSIFGAPLQIEQLPIAADSTVVKNNNNRAKKHTDTLD